MAGDVTRSLVGWATLVSVPHRTCCMNPRRGREHGPSALLPGLPPGWMGWRRPRTQDDGGAPALRLLRRGTLEQEDRTPLRGGHRLPRHLREQLTGPHDDRPVPKAERAGPRELLHRGPSALRRG